MVLVQMSVQGWLHELCQAALSWHRGRSARGRSASSCEIATLVQARHKFMLEAAAAASTQMADRRCSSQAKENASS